MLPHKHFIVAVTIILVTGLLFFPSLSFAELLMWSAVGGIMAMAVDLDVMVLMSVIKLPLKLEKYKNPSEVFKDYWGYMRALCGTKVLRTVLATHLLISAVFISVFYFFANFFFVPVLLGILSHLVADMIIIGKIKLL